MCRLCACFVVCMRVGSVRICVCEGGYVLIMCASFEVVFVVGCCVMRVCCVLLWRLI